MTDWRECLQTTVGPGILAGIDLRGWWSLLRDNGWSVDPRYLPRANVITLNAILNTVNRRREERWLTENLTSAEIPPPIVILGHWRSGTSHLHNLLSLDPQFTSPNVYQTSFPHTFLATEERNAKLIQRFLPRTRPMDNVKLSLDSPNEDEFAYCTLTGPSPYMSWVFPRRADHYDQFLTFDEVSEEQVQQWKNAVLLFMRKMAYKDPRLLILKSPPHTCRIRLLLDLFQMRGSSTFIATRMLCFSPPATRMTR